MAGRLEQWERGPTRRCLARQSQRSRRKRKDRETPRAAKDTTVAREKADEDHDPQT
jgi:hypothetical protein